MVIKQFVIASHEHATYANRKPFYYFTSVSLVRMNVTMSTIGHYPPDTTL
jgi:hypothetical protein